MNEDDQPATRGDLRAFALKSDLAEVRTELKADIAQVRTELEQGIALVVRSSIEEFAKLRSDFTGLRSEFATMRSDFAGLRSEFTGLRSEFTGLATSFATMRADLNADITRHINAMYERSHAEFVVLADQAKATSDRQDRSEHELASVREDLERHRGEPGLHRRR